MVDSESLCKWHNQSNSVRFYPILFHSIPVPFWILNKQKENSHNRQNCGLVKLWSKFKCDFDYVAICIFLSTKHLPNKSLLGSGYGFLLSCIDTHQTKHTFLSFEKQINVRNDTFRQYSILKSIREHFLTVEYRNSVNSMKNVQRQY